MIGLTIKDIRKATATEARKLGLESDRFNPLIVIVLSNGALITASMDEEGNGPGALFTLETNGTSNILSGR